MPKKKSVKVKTNPDDSVTVYNVPTKQGDIEVLLRPVEYEDEQLFLQRQGDPLANYQFVSSLVRKWGDREASEVAGELKSPITALELKANGKAMKVLDGVIDQCFLEIVEVVEVT